MTITNIFTVILIVMIVTIGIVMIIKSKKKPKANGILHIDMTGEKDNYLFEVITPFEDLAEYDEVLFKIEVRK